MMEGGGIGFGLLLPAMLVVIALQLGLGCLGVMFARAPIGRVKAIGAVIYGFCMLIACALVASAATHLILGRAAEEWVLPVGLPWLGAHFRLDALAATFLCIVNISAAGACLFAIGYGRHEESPGRVIPYVPFFLAGMNAVVLADDAFTFLVAWEFMSLSSWALVMAHHRSTANARAGFLYIVMASLGGIALLLCFGVLAGSGGAYDFASMRDAATSSLIATIAFTLALVGAGSKAGLAPLHVWLPEAHPAAPSHVSALMSGAMTKVAVYGFVRIAFDLIGAPLWWWGLILMAVGSLSAVLGILFALLQTDMKRALAYSTIENIGFVFAGLGLAMAFEANGMHTLAALAFTAALFHAFNHALFKTLLFCGAGAVLGATGTRNLERLGGLIHRMPWTAGAFLVGSAAISALPPLNGFASEWLTLQAILLSPNLPQFPLKILVPGVGAGLALAAALAGACFVRIYGIAFLGRPRSPEAATAHEVDAWSAAAMLVLATLCLAVGLLPGFFVDAFAGAVRLSVGASVPAQSGNAWLALVPVAESRSSYSALLVFAFMLSSMAVAVVSIHWFASRAARRAPTWDCGFPDPSPQTQYSAGSIAQPTRRVFNTFVYRAEETVEMPAPGSVEPARFRVAFVDRAWSTIYAPISGLIGYAADRLNVLQFLTIRRYLGFVFGSLIVLLLGLALWP